jgi:dTMP kinase
LSTQRFIVFEGLDGAGKSTLLHRLKLELEKRQEQVLVTREPGGTVIGEELRQVILRRGTEAPSPRTELLLYEAARAQHVDLLIRPNLEAGNWVLCDRFSASSVAFQAGGRQIPSERVTWLNDFATGGLKPALTVLLDLPYAEAKKRQEKRFAALSEQPDRMEAEARDFHERVRESFLRQAAEDPRGWLVLSALLNPDDLLKELLQLMEDRGLWAFSNQP